MNKLLLFGTFVTALLTAGVIVIPTGVLQRLQRYKRLHRGLFTSMDSAVSRESKKVLDALHASVSPLQLHANEPIWRVPNHRLLAEASEEHTGLLCDIVARPGSARLRIKKAVRERVMTSDSHLEDIMRECLAERPSKMATRRRGDNRIVLLDRKEAVRYFELLGAPGTDYAGYYADEAEKLSAGRDPNALWETAYNGTVTVEGPWDDDSIEVVHTVCIALQELKGVKESFEKVHRVEFGGNPPLPFSDARETPVSVSIREAELAYHIIVDWVLRLASKKSRRLNELLWRMESLRKATLRAFPAYAAALETAATEADASKARVVGANLHNIPHTVVRAFAACMTDMERSFVAMGVFACIEARVEKRHDMAAAFDWRFENPWDWDTVDRWPLPAPAYVRTLGSRSFRRKLDTILGEEITTQLVSAYDDAIAARELQSRVASAFLEYGALLPKSADETLSVVQNDPNCASSVYRKPIRSRRRKMKSHEKFRQAVDDRIASVLCEPIESKFK